MSAKQPERRIGLGGAILLAFNGAVGAGIFALPATLAADFGALSPWLFPLVGLASLLIVIPFARSVAAFPTSGGPATYGLAFGRVVGFELGWVYYISRAAAFAANVNVLTAYLARWWTGADQGLTRAAIIIAVAAVLAIANIVGVRRALRLLGGLTLLKALPLVVVAIAAIVLTFPPPAPGPLPALSQLEAGALVVFYAFIGFENAVVPAGETRRPQSTLPRAVFATIGMTVLLYFLVQLAFVSALPGGGSDDKAPLLDLGAWLAGPLGATVLTFAAIASLGGNLHSNLTSTPHVTAVLAARGDLPTWFGRSSKRFATPANAIVFMAAVSALLALSGTFVVLAVISTLARLFVYSVTIAALPRAPGRPPVTALHWVGGAVGIALCAWAAAQADGKAWTTLAALAAGGLVLYAIAVRRSSTAADSVTAIQPPPSSRDPS